MPEAARYVLLKFGEWLSFLNRKPKIVNRNSKQG